MHWSDEYSRLSLQQRKLANLRIVSRELNFAPDESSNGTVEIVQSQYRGRNGYVIIVRIRCYDDNDTVK